MRHFLAALATAALPAAAAAQARPGAATLDAEIARITAKVVAWRRDFHQHPELLFALDRTSGLVAERQGRDEEAGKHYRDAIAVLAAQPAA